MMLLLQVYKKNIEGGRHFETVNAMLPINQLGRDFAPKNMCTKLC